jgi:hypothetical protein
MDRKTYNWAKRTGREAYEQAIRDMEAIGGGGQPLPDTEQHRHPDYSLIDHEHDGFDDTALWEDQKRQDEYMDEMTEAIVQNQSNIGQLVGHQHEDLQAQVDHNEDRINSLEHELEALADTREAGEWEYKNVWELRGSGFALIEAHNFTRPTNIMEITNLDASGNTHGFARVEVGDYVEIVQEHDTRAVGDYGLYVVSAVRDGGSDTKIFDLTLEQGKGAPTLNSKCIIKFFHLQDNIDLADLDARYAPKGHAHNQYLTSLPSHTHSYASTSHKHDSDYATSNHSHSVIFRSGTTTNPSLSKGEPFLNTTYKVIYVGT